MEQTSTQKAASVSLTPISWDELFRQVQELPTSPAVAARLLPLVAQADLSLADLEMLVLQDPALTSKVMRLANSTLFGAAGRISTMGHALARMDIYAAKLIALSFHLDASAGQPGRFDCQRYWRESCARGAVAARLARLFPEVNIDEARVAGLLCGIGRFFLSEALGAEYTELLELAERGDSLEPLERSRFGADGVTVSGMLLAHWHFPRGLADAIQAHPHPKTIDALPEHPRELAKVLHLADRIVDVVLFARTERLGDLATLASTWARIEQESLDALLGQIRAELDAREDDFDDSDLDGDELLAQAKRQMIDVSLITARNLDNKARQAEESQQQLEALRRQHDSLAQQVTTDPLTEIGNRKFFDVRLGEEIKRCKRNRTPLSLVLFDLDHFKRLNDTFGHQAGDMVLKKATKEIGRVMRTTDVVARYGGEEFAVIAPETDQQGATATADRMRSCLENVLVHYNGRRLRVTGSFGVATVLNPDKLRSAEHLIELADGCLYQAKHAGRNCVRSTVL